MSTSLVACCSPRVSVPRWALWYSTCPAHSKMHSVLVVHGCAMNDHRFSSSTQHTCTITVSGGQDGTQAHSLAGPSVPGLVGCSCRVEAVVSSGGLTWEESPSMLTQDIGRVHSLRSYDPGFLPATCWRPPPHSQRPPAVLENADSSLPCGLSPQGCFLHQVSKGC